MIAAALVAACSEASESDDSSHSSAGTAGSAGSNGATGNAAGSGGTNASGGANANGGASGSGAQAGSASSNTAGTNTSGGSAGAASGGTTGEGDAGNAGTGAEAGSPAAGGAANDAGNAGTGAAGAPGGAVPSPGCDTENATSGRFTIDVDGTEREYILKLPESYDPSHPYPLIFGWHGRMYDAEWVANGEAPLTGPYFGIESEAAGRAIFIAPQALDTGWSDQDGRDLAFALAMVERSRTELCVDESRLFSTGFSFGAIMTLVIGCTEGDVFRAIAPMSGSLSNGCPASDQPVAYWSSHGTQDTTITPAQGEAARDEFLARNHCEATSQPSEPEGCVRYDGCDPGYPVSFCTFEGAHVPPPFAGEAIWSFFSQF